MKKTLSLILAVLMIFGTTAVAFAENEVDDSSFDMYLIPPGPQQICRGESVKIEAIYDYGKYEDITLVWSVEGDSCRIKEITDKKTGVARAVKVTSTGEGYSTIKVDMVSEKGEVIQSDEITIEGVSLKERLEYAKSSSVFGFMVAIFILLDFIFSLM